MSGKVRKAGSEKLAVPEMVPGRLRRVPDQELLAVNRRLHQLFAANFEGNSSMTAGDLNREDLVNAAIFVWQEMKRRRMTVAQDTALWQAANRLRKEDDEPEALTLETMSRDEMYALLSTQLWESDDVDAAENDGDRCGSLSSGSPGEVPEPSRAPVEGPDSD